MDEPGRLEAKGLARAKIRSQRRRVSLIRRRALRGSLILFAAAWAIVFGQLVTGNDPVLSHAFSTRKLAASTHRVGLAGNGPSGRLPREPKQEGAVVPAVPSEEAAPEGTEPHAVAPPPAPAPIITSAS